MYIMITPFWVHWLRSEIVIVVIYINVCGGGCWVLVILSVIAYNKATTIIII